MLKKTVYVARKGQLYSRCNGGNGFSNDAEVIWGDSMSAGLESTVSNLP